MKRTPFPALVLVLLVSAAVCGAADLAWAERTRPPATHLVGAGLAMGVPVYFLGVTWHEGSHALVAKAFGAKITHFSVLPERDPKSGAFFFGRTSFQGRLSDQQKLLFFLVPSLTDLAILGTCTGLVLGDALPDNAYARLALGVFATGAWVDFSKNLFARHRANDLMRAHALRGRTRESQRWPWRALHAGVIAATGYIVYRGFEDLFDAPVRADTMLQLPLWQGAW